jgi:hypothetical protein
MNYAFRNAILGAILALAFWLLSLAGCGPLARHGDTVQPNREKGKKLGVLQIPYAGLKDQPSL